jgi:molybdate transport system permease protein
VTRRQSGGSAPTSVTLLAAIGAAFLIVPLVALAVRAPWGDMTAALTSPVSLTAARLSLVTTLLAAGLSLLFGVPLAWVLARPGFRGQTLLRALVVLPLVLPPVVGGVALLSAFGRRGLVGQWLYDWMGVQLPFSTAGVVLAETFVAMPFLVLTVEAALRGSDRRLEAVAATLGASPLTVFRRVSLPMVAPAIVAGTVLAWARALGEFGATITFAGNFPGKTQTIPLAVYSTLESDRNAAIALSVLMMAVSLLILVLLRHRFLGASPAQVQP